MEEVPAEQTRVYQNQPNPPVQPDTWPTPESPPRLQPGVEKKKKKTSPSGPEPDAVGENSIEEDPSVLTHRSLTNVGLDGNGAIWVSEITEQPGFLFPVTRPTTPPPFRRQITEEASLSVTPNQVVRTTPPRSTGGV